MNNLFEYPHILLCAALSIPSLIFFFLRYNRIKRNLNAIAFGHGDNSIAETEGKNENALRQKKVPESFFPVVVFRAVCFTIAWVLLVIAAASPRWGVALTPVRQAGVSVIFVMDISRSMTVSDIQPSRLQFAASYASILVDKMPGAACGVVLVKGSGTLAVPLTTDHRSIHGLLETVSPTMLSAPGSGIADGISLAIDAFPHSGVESKTIILFTDGDETSGSLEESARAVNRAGATLIIVGTGTITGAELNVLPGADEPRMETTCLREELLQNLAKLAGRESLYVNGTDTGSAYRVLKIVLPQQTEKHQIVYVSKPIYRYRYFLLAALIFFCLGYVSGGRIWHMHD